MQKKREAQLIEWLHGQLPRLGEAFQGEPLLEAVSGDASFRRYFRISLTSATAIAVDAPPEHEDNEAFVRVNALLTTAQVEVPAVIAVDLQQGFLLLSDLATRCCCLDLPPIMWTYGMETRCRCCCKCRRSP